MGEPELSVLVLSWNTKDLTLRCLAALAADEPKRPREVLVLDNASTDGSADAIATRHPEVRLLRSGENLGFARGCNRLAREARGRYLCLLNSDTEVPPGGLDALVDFLEEAPDYGACAPKLVSPDGGVQRSCKRFPTLATVLVYDMCWASWPLLRRIDDRYFMRDFDHLHDADVEQPPAACFVVRADLWRRLGGFDPELWLFYNDVDLCLRIRRAGRRIRYLASVAVLHHEGASTKNFADFVPVWAADRIRYHRKHHGRFGAFLVRLMLRLRALEEWWAIGRRHRDRAARRAARRHLREVLARALGR